MRIRLASTAITAVICVASFTVWSAWGDELSINSTTNKKIVGGKTVEITKTNLNKLLGKPDDKTTQLLKAKKTAGQPREQTDLNRF